MLFDPRGTERSDRPADLRAYAIEDYVADVEARDRFRDEVTRHLSA